MESLNQPDNPAERWQRDAARHGADAPLRLRLAAMAGHMRTDRVAARRASLIDLLADGRPHTGHDLRGHVEREVSAGCWGRRPAETLLRDLRALRRGGIRIAYSRQPGLEGYYLDYPPLAGRDATRPAEDDAWTEHLRQMTVPQKQAAASASADFALRQKRLLLAEERPDWPADRVEREARRLVYGT